MIATADEKWNLEPSDVLSLVDANRPLTSPEVYRESVALARKFGVACPFVKLADGVARVDASGAITRILDRGGLTRIATPESFTWESFLALPDEVVGNLGLLGIAEMFVAAGKNVQTFQSNEFSLKLTHPEDWELFLRLVRYRLEDVGQPKLLEFLADEPGPEATLNSSGVPS
jgi:2-C-methyl-D-erythritol 4-phosphate cytidylyltransferase